MSAVLQKEIDIALAARYAGLSIDVDSGAGPVTTSVSVFVEEPSSEEAPERVYPSISVKFLGMIFDAPRAHSDDEEKAEILFDTGPTPPERTSRQRGEPFRLQYSIDTWHKPKVSESRDLLALAIQQLTPPRGFMPCVDLDSVSTDLDVHWSGGVVTLDEVLPDVTIYHKSLTVDVLASLLTDPVLEVAKTVVSIDWSVKSRRITLDSNGGVVVIPGEDVLDIKFRITDGAVGPSP